MTSIRVRCLGRFCGRIERMDLAQLVQDVGLPVALVIYLLYRDHKRASDDRREKLRLVGRIDALEKELHGELRNLVAQAMTTA